MPEWFEELSDDLWLRPDEQGEEEAGFLRRTLGVGSGHRVLDAPCGAGRIGVHLALAGCAVTGVDIRPAFVARARDRFQATGVSGAFAVLDMRAIDWCGEFDGVYNWGGSFGYFHDWGNAELIRRYSRALRAGGRLVVEQPNRERILRGFRAELASDRRVVRNRWDARRDRMESRFLVVGVHRPRDRSSIRLYTPGQMRALFEGAGLRIEAVYGDVRGAPYTRAGEKLVVVGRKDGSDGRGSPRAPGSS